LRDRRQIAILPPIVVWQEEGMNRSVDVETIRRWLADGCYGLSGFGLAAS
jgi:hypothetical protein